MKKIAFLLLFVIALNADEYDFDMSAIEKKPYEYGGYLRLDDKAQHLNADEYQNYLHLEALFDFSYGYEAIKIHSSFITTYDYIKDTLKENKFSANDLYFEVQLNANHSVLIGKESLMWGKGYFFNPVAFFDRPKDPNDPTKAREGFVITKYSYNKSFNSVLKNLSLDLVYLPSSQDVNSDYYDLVTPDRDSNNAALRLYMLLYDTDIDIIYNYSDEASDKIGIDFSKNLQTNFEIHGEYANILDEGDRYLLGLRYLSKFELTIISEYIYRSDGLNKEQIQSSNSKLPFLAKDYVISLFTQKEPFDILYFSLYYKNTLNLQDYSMQNKIGFGYLFKNNIDIDLSYNVNSGDTLSEFGKKAVEDFLWLRMTWKF